MSYEKQPQLNGGYYGPPIPPPRSSHRHGRSGRSCCSRCGCCLLGSLCDCGCCLLSCVFKIIFGILIAIGLVILLLWLIIRPHALNFHVTDASLTSFSYASTTHQLNYDLSLNLTARNPNKHIGVYYDLIRANAIYAGQRLSTKEVDTFYQGTKNTTDLGPLLFKGQNAVVLGVEQDGDYQTQKGNGEFKIDVKLDLKVRFKIGLIKTHTFKPKIKCGLTVPLDGDSAANGKQFEDTKCHYDLW